MPRINILVLAAVLLFASSAEGVAPVIEKYARKGEARTEERGEEKKRRDVSTDASTDGGDEPVASHIMHSPVCFNSSVVCYAYGVSHAVDAFPHPPPPCGRSGTR